MKRPVGVHHEDDIKIPLDHAAETLLAPLQRLLVADMLRHFPLEVHVQKLELLLHRVDLVRQPEREQQYLQPDGKLQGRGSDEIDREHGIGPEHKDKRADDDKGAGRGVEARRPHAPVEREDHDDEQYHDSGRGAHGRGDHHREIIKEDGIDQEAGNARVHDRPHGPVEGREEYAGAEELP